MEQPETQESTASTAPGADEQHVVDDHGLDTTSELQTEQPLVDDDEEIEHDGEKYRVPKKLKDAFLLQADYTRKTQALAEERKGFEAERTQAAQRAQVHQAVLDEVADVRHIDKQLAQFQNLDWATLAESDPLQAQKLDLMHRQLISQRERLVGSITQKEQALALDEQQSAAKQVEQIRQYAQREIPGWSPEYDRSLKQYAIELGFKPENLRITNPLSLKLLHDSYTLRQLTAKQTTKPKPEAQEKPVTKITSQRAVAQKDPDKMSTEEWMKWREGQVRKTNKR